MTRSASRVWSSFWASYSPTMEKENFKIIFCQIQVSWSFLLAAAELKTFTAGTADYLLPCPRYPTQSFFGGHLEDVFQCQDASRDCYSNVSRCTAMTNPWPYQYRRPLRFKWKSAELPFDGSGARTFLTLWMVCRLWSLEQFGVAAWRLKRPLSRSSSRWSLLGENHGRSSRITKW